MASGFSPSFPLLVFEPNGIPGGAELRKSELTEKDVDAFLKAEATRDFEGLRFARSPWFMGVEGWGACSVADLKLAQRFAHTMLRLKRAVDGGEVTPTDLEGLSYTPGMSVREWVAMPLIREHRATTAYRDRFGEQATYPICYAGDGEKDALARICVHGETFKADEASAYLGFLGRCASSRQCKSLGWVVADNTNADGIERTGVGLVAGIFPDTSSGRMECAKRLIDALNTLHLADIASVTANGGEEARMANTGLSALWWLLIDRMRGGGRVAVCEECGKPFITKVERGTPARYCSQTCKKRAYRKRRYSPADSGDSDTSTSADEQKGGTA